MQIVNNIQNLVRGNYNCKISSRVDVHEDDYNQGELDWVNGWSGDIISFDATDENIVEYIKHQLTNYISSELDMEYTEAQIIEAMDSYMDDNNFFISQAVDVDNCEPTEDLITKWKKGEEKLYTQDACITITINGKELPIEILVNIMKGGK